MGEVLTSSIADDQRLEWIAHINSYENRGGGYTDTNGHGFYHTVGMTVGALGVLGGRKRFSTTLWEPLASEQRAVRFLEEMDWHHQWDGAHAFWGALLCFSFASMCTDSWRTKVLSWLDAEADPVSGWWRRGVSHGNRHQALGGFARIIPMYQHHRHRFPYPERTVDSLLAMQLPSGNWDANQTGNVLIYLDMDALYSLMVVGEMAPAYRRVDIQTTLSRFAAAVRR